MQKNRVTQLEVSKFAAQQKIETVLFTQFENVPFCCDNNCKVRCYNFVVFLKKQEDKKWCSSVWSY